MSRSLRRSAILAGITALAVFGPASSAQAVSKVDKAQSAAIKKVGKSAARAGKAAKSAGESAQKASAAARQANDGVNMISGLLGPALATIADLRASFQSLAAGLAVLTSSAGSDEYGVVQIAFGAGVTPIPGCFFETGDIPDNQQGAVVSGTCLVPDATATAPRTPVPAGAAVHILAAIRSNESDGVATPNAIDAGVASIVAYQQTGAVAAGNTTNDGGVAVVTPLGSGLTVGNGAGLPAIAIPLKSPLTSASETSFPFSLISTDRTVDLAATQFSGTPSVPLFGPANSRVVTISVRFNDLTAAGTDPTG